MELKHCAHCGSPAELTFKWPVYGAGGCEVKCVMCGVKAYDFGYSETHFDEDRGAISTPVTLESIVRCIERAIEKWNHRVGEGETK